MVVTCILLLGALLPGAAEDVVARVDSAAITTSEISARVSALKASGMPAKAPDALNSLIDDALIVAEGERLDLARSPDVARRVEAKRRELAAQRMLDVELAGVRATDADARAMYHRAADQIRLDLVVLETREQAQAVLDRLRAGATFKAESSRSLDPASAARDGDTGLMLRMNVQDALVEPAFSAPPKTPAGPVALRVGWAVFQVRERRIADEKGFAAARDDILRRATEQLREQAKAHFLQQKRAALQVKLDEAFLDRTGVSLDPSPADRDHVLATVGGAALRYGDILPDVAAIARGAQRAHASGPAVKKDVAGRRIEQLVLEGEAMARGFGRDARVEAGVAAERRTLVGVAAALRLRESAPAPTDGEIAAWYAAHAAEFPRSAHRECSQVVVASADEAADVRRRLDRGEKLEEVARRVSTDAASAGSGGRIGVIDLGRLDEVARTEPALASAIRDAKPGEPSAPVRSRAGWHLLRCGPITPAQPAPLPEVRDAVLARLRAERSDGALRAGLAALRARAKISIDEQRLASAAAAP